MEANFSIEATNYTHNLITVLDCKMMETLFFMTTVVLAIIAFKFGLHRHLGNLGRHSLCKKTETVLYDAGANAIWASNTDGVGQGPYSLILSNI